MKTRIYAFLALASILCFGANAQQQESAKSMLDRITVRGFGMLGYDHHFTDGNDMGGFHIRLSEIIVDGRITDRWSFGITSQFNNPVILKDLYMEYKISNALRIKLGQFKTPYSLENQIAPFLSNLIPGASHSGIFFNGIGIDPRCYGIAGRDIGLEFKGDIVDNKLSYRIMLMNGQGMNAKIDTRPTTHAASLKIHLNDNLFLYGSYMTGTRLAQSDAFSLKAGEKYHRTRTGLALSGEYKDLRFVGEWLWGKDEDMKSTGFYLTGAYQVAPKVELIAAYDGLTLDTSDFELQNAFTLGAQYWFYGRCRAQVQYRFIDNPIAFGKGVSSVHAIMTQLQFVF
ncbi:porin [Porphyromonas sp.]|uniref:porin n=1 Tax=Porphyromonas sp. TaxID=1924944 RepID=UPI0026DC19FB|nr:porin [Porphyromonas sp.]MDO4771487.1 porin [Porphyromonas sp.]